MWGEDWGGTGVGGTAGYDAAQGASAEVGGGVELDTGLALVAAAGHLGGCLFGCHGAALGAMDSAEMGEGWQENNGLLDERLGARSLEVCCCCCWSR